MEEGAVKADQRIKEGKDAVKKGNKANENVKFASFGQFSDTFKVFDGEEWGQLQYQHDTTAFNRPQGSRIATFQLPS